ncbi:hypothetical protein [Alteromonas sp. ASW11-130]|uniref:hypothetical protein n=1 Tax=Alteromonas sp. ASW11-130 TaxID=3015775 RepID=UPI0022425EC8|nr:hypothetical protein [Alteromonas sp. ASW11-130]MCW8090649.1 hypothetical protein [Alteromonas sp. ASW11-130]
MFQKLVFFGGECDSAAGNVTDWKKVKFVSVFNLFPIDSLSHSIGLFGKVAV